MARNTGEGYRTGVIAGRTQTYNPKTGKYVKRDKKTGKIISCKDTPYKNVVKDSRAKEQYTSKNSKK